MVLCYKGSVRSLRGSGVPFAYPEGRLENAPMHVFLPLDIQGMMIRLDQVQEEGIAFTLSFFQNEEQYFVKTGEQVIIHKEGNAFACELHFVVE